MAKSGMKLVRNPRNPPKTQYAAVRAEVRKRLQTVADEHVRLRNDVTRNWQDDHRPKFASKITVGKQIVMEILITNGSKSLGKYGGTIADLWRWINEGTRAHTIVPRFASILRFVVDGVVVFARRVRHLGTKAQKHDERINRQLLKRFNNAVDAGYKAGFRKIGKG